MLLAKSVACKSNSILVPLESWMFLQKKGYRERIGKELSEKAIQLRERSFERNAHNGKRQLINGDLGGCRGPVENAWEEGRWTSWSIEDMKKMLDEAGLPWEDGEEVEYIAV